MTKIDKQRLVVAWMVYRSRNYQITTQDFSAVSLATLIQNCLNIMHEVLSWNTTNTCNNTCN